jgi:hypothetical protein
VPPIMVSPGLGNLGTCIIISVFELPATAIFIESSLFVYLKSNSSFAHVDFLICMD